MSDFYPLDKAVNTYKKLQSMEAPSGQQFVVYAYFLFKNPLEDGSVGMHMYLGAYSTPEKALKRVHRIMEKTGHRLIYAVDSCTWEYINPVEKNDRTKKRYLKVEANKTDEELERQCEIDLEEWNEKESKRKTIVEDIENQHILEQNPDTVEHYAHNWFNCIKDKAEYEFHKEKMEYYQKEFEKRKEKIRQQYKKNPSIDENWLSIYEKKLTDRDEKHVYDAMANGYSQLKSEIYN